MSTLISSNRTFMELKLLSKVHWLRLIKGSNCTFMELKFIASLQQEVVLIVLIVPLWN